MHVMLQFVNYLLISLRVASNSSCKKPVNYRYRLKESKDTTLHERQCFINIHHLKKNSLPADGKYLVTKPSVFL